MIRESGSDSVSPMHWSNMEEGNTSVAAVKAKTGKIFSDPVYKQFRLPWICAKIIDTPQFQRLRHIRQLGMKSHVYPGANHTRFEHSIGVCYLAGRAIRQLQRQDPEKFKISDEEVARVEIAGLCHDLGHGPMSHLFESVYKEATEGKEEKFEHEDMSQDMFKLLIEDNKLKEDLEMIAGQHAVVLIQDIIHKFTDEKITEKKLDEDQKSAVEKQREKAYMYHIVANKETGIDVDRWDYLTRDAMYLGHPSYFQVSRLELHMRICKNNEGQEVVAFRDKSKDELLQMSRSRFSLYVKALMHPVCRAVERMVQDAFVSAWDVKFLKGQDGEPFSLSEACTDPKRYQFLEDRITRLIQSNGHNDLRKAKEIFGRIDKRDFYVCVGQIEIQDNEDDKDDTNDILEELDELECEPIRDVAKHDYGSKDSSPLDKVFFYSKENPEQATKGWTGHEQRPSDDPKHWNQTYVRFYLRTLPKDKSEAKEKISKAKDIVSECPDRPPRTQTPGPSNQGSHSPPALRNKRESSDSKGDSSPPKIPRTTVEGVRMNLFSNKDPNKQPPAEDCTDDKEFPDSV